LNIAGSLNQTATYWAPSGSTDLYGKPTPSAPVQIPCRWEERSSQVISKKGEEIISKARVFMLQDVSLDGYLYLGASAQADPNNQSGVYEIQAMSRTPDLSNLESLVTVYL
jgi:hypothetical protein